MKTGIYIYMHAYMDGSESKENDYERRSRRLKGEEDRNMRK